MKGTTGSEAVWMMWSMFLGIDSRLRRLKPHLLSIVSGSWTYNSSPTIDKSILDAVAEAAVVGVSDELTGQAVNAFVSLKGGNEHNDQIKKDLVLQVRKSIGPFAAPKVSNAQLQVKPSTKTDGDVGHFHGGRSAQDAIG